MSSRPTLQDIAVAAGVAASTVCRALRSDRRIPASTQERIRNVAQELGYRPDPLLSALSLRRRGKSASTEITTIAYVMNGWQESRDRASGIRSAFGEACWEGARSRAEDLGYRLEAFSLQAGGMSGRRLSQILYARGISGVCVAPLASPRGHLTLDWKKFSCAAIGYTLTRPDLHRAVAHHYHGILLALREMRRLGYRKIGVYIDELTSKRVDDIWLAGVLLYARRYPKNRFPVLVTSGDSRQTAFRKEILSWFRKERPDAVIGNSAIHQILQDEGIRFPEDIGFAELHRNRKFDGINACIDQRTGQIAAAAIDLIVEQIQKNERGIPSFAKTVMIAGEWRPGRSAQAKNGGHLHPGK